MVKKINERFQQLKDFASTNRFASVGQNALMTAGLFALTPLYAYAIPREVNVESLFDNLILTVCDIFRMIGTILLVWALGQLVMAFRNEDADSKSRAMMVLVCAILLLSVKTIYTTITKDDVSGTSILS